MTDHTLGEIARGLDVVVGRFETLANRLDTTYTRTELFASYQKLADSEHARLSEEIDTLRTRVSTLEDARKWLARAVGGAFISAGVSTAIALVIAFGGKT